VPPGALTVLVGVHHPETAITCGGSQRLLRAGGLPLRLCRGACQRQPLSEHPEARPRPPSPCPDAAPGGTWLRHGQVAHLACVTLPGAQASHRQKQSREHGQVKSVHTRFIHSVSRKLRYCALTRTTSVPMLYGLIELCRSVTPFGGNRRQSSPRQGRSASWWRFNGKILMNPPTQAQ
jgi:hypothetical protein